MKRPGFSSYLRMLQSRWVRVSRSRSKKFMPTTLRSVSDTPSVDVEGSGRMRQAVEVGERFIFVCFLSRGAVRMRVCRLVWGVSGQPNLLIWAAAQRAQRGGSIDHNPSRKPSTHG